MLHKLSTHVWRATLNTMWAQAGVPAEVRAAYFGHMASVNQQSYTDLTDIGPIASMIPA